MYYPNTGTLNSVDEAWNKYGICPRRLYAIMTGTPDRQAQMTSEFDRFCAQLDPLLLSTAFAHEDHSKCTYGTCEYSCLDFTTVKQLHVPHRAANQDCLASAGRSPPPRPSYQALVAHHQASPACFAMKGLFSQDLLVQAVRQSRLTAWAFDGRHLVRHPQPFMALSHVWSDGTGAGNWDPGMVNSCLFDYFARIARTFGCEGIWWDALSTPKEDSYRRKALSTMHRNYEYARVTLVHDTFLRSLPFTDPVSACVAIVLSSWFSRGWTALELAKSPKVKIIFRDSIQDLDGHILQDSRARDSVAGGMIRRLRKGEITSLEDLLHVLGSRYTSWPKDMAHIAANLTGVDLSRLQDDTSQSEIYQAVLKKMQYVSHGHLFHKSDTMVGGFSWCPANLLDMPNNGIGSMLKVYETGDVVGEWHVLTPDAAVKANYECASGAFYPAAEIRVQNGLDPENRHRHVVLACPGDPKSGLLVEVFRREIDGDRAQFKCQYVGPFRCHDEMQIEGPQKPMLLRIGEAGRDDRWRSLTRLETAWDLIDLSDLSDLSEEAIATLSITRPSREQQLVVGGSWSACHHAVWTGNLKKAKRALHCLGTADDLGRLPVHLAAERGQLAALDALLSCRQIPGRVARLETRDAVGRTPLHYAAYSGSLETVKILQTDAYHVGTPDQRGDLPLHIAAEAGHSGLVSSLCTTSNISSRNTKGLTPLHMAVLGGHTETVRNLLERGADVRATVSSHCRWSALHLAAGCGHLAVSELLLEKLSSIHDFSALSSRDGPLGWTPLHLAAMTGSPALLALLEPFARQLQSEDHFGWSPSQLGQLHTLGNTSQRRWTAAKWSRLHILGIDGLESHMTSIVALDKDSMATMRERLSDADPESLLVIAAHMGYHIALGKLLQIARRTKSFPCTIGNSALHSAIRGGSDRAVQLLIQYGADLEGLDDCGCRPIHTAASIGHANAVAALLEGGANHRTTGSRGQTSLHYAIKSNHEDVIEMLAGQLGLLESRDWDGHTPLGVAIDQNRPTALKLLLKSSQNTMLCSSEEASKLLCQIAERGHIDMMKACSPFLHSSGTTEGEPLRLAAKHGHTEMVKLLLDRRISDDRPNDTQDTALHTAAEQGHLQVVDTLLRHRKYRNACRSSGEWPIDLAVRNGHTAVVAMLLKHGESSCRIFNPRYKDMTLLHLAAYHGHVDIVRLLLIWLSKKGRKTRHINEAGPHGQSPLHIAAAPCKCCGYQNQCGGDNLRRAAVIQMLMEHGADKDFVANESTALVAATHQQRKQVIRILLDTAPATERSRQEALRVAEQRHQVGLDEGGRSQPTGWEDICKMIRDKVAKRPGFFARLMAFFVKWLDLRSGRGLRGLRRAAAE